MEAQDEVDLVSIMGDSILKCGESLCQKSHLQIFSQFLPSLTFFLADVLV